MWRWSLSAMWAVVAASACTSSKPVRLEDGSSAHDVSCPAGPSECAREARYVCGRGPYTVLAEETDEARGRVRSQRIQCVREHDEASEDMDTRCARAYSDAPATATEWAGWRARDARTPGLGREEFEALCETLPPRIAWCLIAAHRAADRPACETDLASLDVDGKQKLDALFLAPADAGAADASH